MPAPETDMTGQWRYHKTLFGNLILQVETKQRQHPRMETRPAIWRNAKEHDLGVLKLLIDRAKKSRVTDIKNMGGTVTNAPPAHRD
jgi:hypothetical protein